MNPINQCMPQFLKELDALDSAPNVTALVTNPDRPRTSYLGGHCLAAIVGASKYAGPLDIYLQKVESLVVEPNDAMEWGLRLEAVVAQKYSDTTGTTLKTIKTVFHSDYPFLGGSPDYLAVDNPNLMIEIKTAAEELLRQTDENGYPIWGDAGTDEIPQNYFIQVQYYMGLIGRKQTDLAVFFLGPKREFRIYTIKFDEELYKLLIKKGVKFWQDYIDKKVPPPVDTHPSDAVKEYLSRKALAGGSTLQMPEYLDKIAMDLEAKSEARLRLEEEEEELKAHLLSSMAKLGCKKLQGKYQGLKYSVSVQGGKEDNDKTYTEWKYVATKVIKLLGNEEVTNKIIADCTFPPTPKKPYIRGFFQAIRNYRKKQQSKPSQEKTA